MVKEFDQLVLDVLPFLNNASAAAVKSLKNEAMLIHLDAGETIFWEGDTCSSLAIVISGQVRVFKVGENGREITLYRFGRGEGCILTASCILSRATFPAIARTETAVEALIIPAPILREWVAKFPEWQDFVCGMLAARLSDVIATVEEIAFKRMDVRLVEFLLSRSAEDLDKIRMTHQEIASELGTAREVISRILKDLEMEQMVALARGTLTITNRNKMKEWLKKSRHW